MRVIVTGGCGFIGSHVVDALLEGGDGVAVVDAGYEPAVSWARVAGQLGDRLVRGDCAETWRMDAARDTLGGADVVLHLAAQSHVCRSLDAPMDTFRANADTTLAVALWCARRGIPLLYMSTDEVYGDLAGTGWEATGADEFDTPLRPSSPYSAGKAAGEMAVHAVHRSFGLPALILRGSNAWGPRQYGEKLVPIAIRLLRAGIPVPLHGAGRSVRQWLAVEEFAQGVLTAARLLLRAPPAMLCYNLAGPTLATVLDVVAALATTLRAAGAAVPRPCGLPAPDRPGQDHLYHVREDHLRLSTDWCAHRSILDPAELDRLVAAYPDAGPVVLPSYLGPWPPPEAKKEPPCDPGK